MNAFALESVLQLRNVVGVQTTGANVPGQNEITARLRATIEEELASCQRFADATSVEIESVASRLVKAIAPVLASEDVARESRAA